VQIIFSSRSWFEVFNETPAGHLLETNHSSFIHIRVRQVDNRNYTMIKSINIESYKSNVSLTDYGVKCVKVE